MLKRVLLGLLFLGSLLWADEIYLKLYTPDYHPVIENRIEVYKLNKGLNMYKARPFEISGFAPEYKEEIDFTNRQIILSVKVGEYSIAPDVPISFDSYTQNLRRKAFRKSLLENTKTRTTQTQVSTSGVFGEWRPELPPIAIPKAVQKVLGSRPGVLNLDGTQRITFQGSSTKRKQVPIYDVENKSRFDLKMEQETNLRLTGTIGERITVNFKYNSKQDDIFDTNNINVKYTGSEDDILQSVEGGNITLSLSGSRYISYSSNSQGLFGITSKLKYGNLDLSIIASKEESEKNTQSYVGQSQADSTIVRSKDYTARTMYYLWNPYELYQLYQSGEPGIPAGWIGNGIKTSPSGAWLLSRPDSLSLLPENGTVRLFLDDGIGTNNVASAEGDTIFFSPNNFYVPYYDELIEGSDFITDYDSGIITVLRTVDRLHTLAVKYVRRDNAKTPVPQLTESQQNDEILHVHVIRRRNQSYVPYSPSDTQNVWHYQMRNVYSMNKTNIKSDGFNLQVYTLNSDLTRNFSFTDTLATPPRYWTFAEFLRLDSNGDGLINGDDNTVNLARGLVIMPYIEPFDPLGDDEIYEEENESINYLDIKFYISIKGKIGRESLDLAQAGILRGSVRVRVNGIDQRENIDYIVDYDFGRITFLTQAGKDPDAKIEIDYENRSLFSVARKSLAGVRADYTFSDNAKLGGTLIYRSESVADKRPRIGNENIEMWMGDVDGSFTVKPAFITRWLDWLPLISTTAPSQVNLSGELAFTLPKVYGDPDGKKREAYLDDMESIMDSFPLGVTYSTWVLGSKPFGTSFAKGHVNWYNDKNTPRSDIENVATLTEAEQKEKATVLALKVYPSNLNMPGGAGVQSWAGVMKYLGNQLDFSQKKYIEVLLKVDSLEAYPDRNVTMHIELGDLINEDFYTEFGGYNRLNTEDTNNDGQLTIAEDIGLDGKIYGTAGSDPNDLASNVQVGLDYPWVNGTEGNRVLDTEDLDGNGLLNTIDRYFSYTFSISHPSPALSEPLNNKGWVLFRLPITDPTFYEIVNNTGTNTQPTLKKISYARIWIDTDATTRVLIADASVIGNKWQDYGIRYFANDALVNPAQVIAQNTSYLSGIINNQKNSSHYVPPPGTVYTEDDRASTESSLSLQVSKLPNGQVCILRQRMLDSYSLLSYDKLRYWVYPESGISGINNLDLIFRIGADSMNYYQVRQNLPVYPDSVRMVESQWKELEYVLQDMISLKQQNMEVPVDTLVVNGTTYYITYKGVPTLTNIRDIYLGIYNANPQDFSGIVYFDDIRVTDPYQDIGIAKRISLSSVLADFSTLNVDYEDKSENFNPTIQRGRANTFTSTQSLNISNKYFINKLLPNSWSLDMPLNLSRNYSLGMPRYQANSDLLRDNIADITEKERQKNESLTYSADLALSQKTAPKSKILQYTIYRTSLSARIEQAYRLTPTSADTTLTYRGTMNYNLNFPTEKTSIKLRRSYRLGFMPNTWSNTFTYSGTEPKSYNWELRDGVYDWRVRAQTTDSRLFTTDNNFSWALLSDFTATGRWNTKRDLMQRTYYKNYNIGKMTEFVQDLGANYNPNLFPRYFNLTSNLTARYSDTQRKYTDIQNGEQVFVYQRDGNTNRSFRMNVTLQNSSLLAGLASKLKSRQPASDKLKDSDDTQKPKDEEKPERDYFQTPEEQLKEDELKRLLYEQQKMDAEKAEREKELIDEATKEEPKDGEGENKPEDFIPGITDTDLDQSTAKPDTTDVPPPSPPKPKKPPINPFMIMVDYMSKVKNITASYQNTYTMNYTNKTNSLPFAFQIGIPHSVPRDSLESIGNDNTITVGSGVAISRRLDTVVNYSYTDNRRDASASTQSVGYTFPDVTISVMDFAELIGVYKVLTGTRLNSSYQYSVRRNGELKFTKPKQETFTKALNPLIGFTGNFMKVVTTNVSYSVSQTTNITYMDNYDIVKVADAQTINGNLSYSFRSGRGFTVPIIKRRIHIKNEMSSTLGFVYEKNHDRTRGRDTEQDDRNTSRLSITPGATYQFNKDIKGGLTSSYELTSDKRRDDGTRIFSLGIWAEVNL